jgi:hypothetical protein
MPRGGIVVVEDTLSPGVKKFGERLNKGIKTLMQYQTPKVQDYARSNAPWRDRTSNARNGLFAKYTSDVSIGGVSTTHRIVLYHTVPYGIWLEVRWSGKYAIIVPTIQEYGAKVMSALSKLLSKLESVA